MFLILLLLLSYQITYRFKFTFGILYFAMYQIGHKEFTISITSIYINNKQVLTQSFIIFICSSKFKLLRQVWPCMVDFLKMCILQLTTQPKLNNAIKAGLINSNVILFHSFLLNNNDDRIECKKLLQSVFQIFSFYLEVV